MVVLPLIFPLHFSLIFIFVYVIWCFCHQFMSSPCLSLSMVHLSFQLELNRTRVLCPCQTDTESLQLVMDFTHQHSITIIVTYNPPNNNRNTYLSQVSSLIKAVKTKELVVLGDFSLDWNGHASKSYKALASKLGLSQLIDLIFTNHSDNMDILE